MKQTKQCPRCNGTGKVPDPVAVGETMRDIRTKAGLSLRSVAIKCGFSAPYLSDLELGRRNWNEDTTKKVTAAITALTPAQAKSMVAARERRRKK